MRSYPCPICGSRVCDSDRILDIQKLSNEATDNVDLAIKCKVCKNRLAIRLLSILGRNYNCNK